MKFTELQVVKLTGAIVNVYKGNAYNGGEAYEIEIVNNDGTTAALFTISHEDLERMNETQQQ